MHRSVQRSLQDRAKLHQVTTGQAAEKAVEVEGGNWELGGVSGGVPMWARVGVGPRQGFLSVPELSSLGLE